MFPNFLLTQGQCCDHFHGCAFIRPLPPLRAPGLRPPLHFSPSTTTTTHTARHCSALRKFSAASCCILIFARHVCTFSLKTMSPLWLLSFPLHSSSIFYVCQRDECDWAHHHPAILCQRLATYQLTSCIRFLGDFAALLWHCYLRL